MTNSSQFVQAFPGFRTESSASQGNSSIPGKLGHLVSPQGETLDVHTMSMNGLSQAPDL